MKKILLLIVVLFGLMFFREFAMSNEVDNSHGYAYENDTIDNETNLFPTDYFNSDYPWSQGWVSLNDANANKNLNKGEVAS